MTQLSCSYALGRELANNCKQYRKLIQKSSTRTYNEYIRFKIAVAPATCQDSGDIFQQDCYSAQDTLVF